jgi:hypothetical protein
MGNVSKIDRLLVRLHRAGRSVGETAFGGEAVTWRVYGTQGGDELRAESPRKVEAWGRRADRQRNPGSAPLFETNQAEAARKQGCLEEAE